MSRQIRSFMKVLPGLVPLLLAGPPALAATDLPGTFIPLPPPGSTTGTAPVQYPFQDVKATAFTNANRMHHHYRTAYGNGGRYRSMVEYHIHFTLNPASDGLAPPGENTLLTVAPDPSNPQAAQLPTFQVSVPNGCFVDMSYHRAQYAVDGLGCGVEVSLRDPLTMMNTSLNDYVRHFRMQLALRPNSSQGEARVRIDFAGFNAPLSVNPSGLLNFTVGNDGVTQLPMTAPGRRHDHQWRRFRG